MTLETMTSFSLYEAQIFSFLFQDSSPVCSSHLLSLSLLPFIEYGCHKLAISSLIGVAMIFVSFLVKAPTIYNIISSRKAVGFSMTAVYLDCILYSNATFYGLLMEYPFSAYGETAVQLIQSLVMVLVIWKYADSGKGTSKTEGIFANVSFPAILAYVAYLVFVFGFLPKQYTHILVQMNLPVVFINRGSQISLNYRNKSTGSTSLLTMILQGSGSFVRIITTLIQIGLDMSLLINYSSGAALNGALIVQYFLYKNVINLDLKNSGDDSETEQEREEREFIESLDVEDSDDADNYDDINVQTE